MKVAILVEHMFEQVELTQPRKALDQAGAQTVLISPQSDHVQSVNHVEKGDKFKVDLPLDRANPEEFDALTLPGGVANPDRLRMNPKAMQFVKREHHDQPQAGRHSKIQRSDAAPIRRVAHPRRASPES